LAPVLAIVVAACARQEMPPGTGPDFDPPAVVEMFPEYGTAVPDIDEDAFVRFDEPMGDPRSVARAAGGTCGFDPATAGVQVSSTGSGFPPGSGT